MENLCQFVNEDDAGYLNWSRRMKENGAKKDLENGSILSDSILEERNIERMLQKEYALWERIFRKILGAYVVQFPKNILKFQNEKGVISYREIDFIVKLGNSLLLCEIKARNHCDQNNIKSSTYKNGWRQVRKSHNIAKKNYSLVRPLLIMIDMSYVFDISYLPHERRPEYVNITHLCDNLNNLDKFISSDYHYKEDFLSLIWLDSKEFWELSRKNNLLQDEDLLRFRNVYDKSRKTAFTKKIFTFESDIKEFSSPFSNLKSIMSDRDQKEKDNR